MVIAELLHLLLEQCKCSDSWCFTRYCECYFSILGDVTECDWLHTPLHKLNGKSAVELVKTEKGEKALKAFIMRLPN